MALEAVVFSQDPFTYGCSKDYLYSFLGGGGGGGGGGSFQEEAEEEKILLGIINNNIEQSLHATTNWDTNLKEQQWEYNSHSSPEDPSTTVDQPSSLPVAVAGGGRRKRRRTKSAKNKEEIESQRMTHIAVERNRRKQMNEYLAVLRSLMPPSYVQRGDQASIIGGAINFVKELEQLLQSMEGQKKMNPPQESGNGGGGGLNGCSPFSEFFCFPQYTTRETQSINAAAAAASPENQQMVVQEEQKQWAVADIEVTMVDSHANMKVLTKKRPGQLMKMVVGLQSMRLNILHLNVTTLQDMVLYSVSVKVEDGCQLNSVDEIAAAVNQLLRTVQEEATFN